MLRLEPINASLQGRSAVRRPASLFVEFKSGAPENMNITFIDPVKGAIVRKQSIK